MFKIINQFNHWLRMNFLEPSNYSITIHCHGIKAQANMQAVLWKEFGALSIGFSEFKDFMLLGIPIKLENVGRPVDFKDYGISG